MASPTVVTTAVTSDGAPVTSHTVNLPASLVNGNLLLMVFTAGVAAGTVTATGWTFMTTEGASQSITIGYKTSNGSEGATVTVSTTGNTKACTSVYQISGWTGTPEKGTIASGTSTTPDPPNLTPSWGSADNLWIAACAVANNGSIVTAAPTNYTNLLTQGSTGGSTVIDMASAERQLTASSEDPGTFTLSVSKAWNAQTVAVQGTGGGGGPYIKGNFFLFF